MALHPEVKALLDQMEAPPFDQLSVEEARQGLALMATLQSEPPPVAVVSDRTIPTPEGDIPIRIYTPEGTPPFPVLVYFHGGGFVLGGLDTHDSTCRGLATAGGCAVVSVDYRLAPEHKFPAAAEDAYAATCWASTHAPSFGAESGRLAVGGDSAGGNLAAVTALMARDRHGPALAAQLLIYPVTDASQATASYRDNGDSYFLTAAMMRWFWNHYLAGTEDGRNPYASPLSAPTLAGLPPALVITAEFDPLRDEGEAYAARLSAAGVAVRLSRYDGMIHGFFSMGGLLDQGRRAMAEAGAALRAAFGERT